MKKPTTTILLIALAVSVSLQIWTYFQRVEMTQKAEIASLRAHEAEKQAIRNQEEAAKMKEIAEKQRELAEVAFVNAKKQIAELKATLEECQKK